MMTQILRSFRNTPSYAMLAGRRRVLVALGIPLIILGMLWSGVVVEVDTHTSNTMNGIRIGPAQNSSMGANATVLTERPKITYTGYSRPGFELPLAKGIPLRIVALGASTTRGDSPADVDNNGFRRPLRQKLTALGHQINFVGTERLGNMTDNDIAAGPGVRVDTIHEIAKGIVPQSKPNLILINAGTNDCLMHVDIDNFYKRYDDLVQYLLTASHKVTLVMGTLLPTWNEHFNGREDVFRVNPQIRRLAKIYQKQGLPVVLAEMQGPDGIQDQNLAEDGMHPATPGYEMMATKIFDAIVEADARGFLQPPEKMSHIPYDGEEGRKDEINYQNWLKQQKVLDEIAAREESEIAKMEAELERLSQQRRASTFG